MAWESRAARVPWGCLAAGRRACGGNKTRNPRGLLADGPGRGLRPALRVKPAKSPVPQGPREEAGLPHLSESKNGMTT